jgi:integrase
LLDQLPEPHRTMAVVAQCTGLRVSEILTLKWSDVDFENLTMRVTRKIVNGRVNRLKTEYSEDDLPMDPDFGTHLLAWRRQCPPSPEGWLFPNPLTCQPYYASEIQKDYLRPAGRKVDREANGQPVNLGWHTFRHTYRSLLDATGAPIGVQQKPMRHAQVSTTMDVYGNALMESKREANSKVVSLLLRPSRDTQSLQQ